MEYSTSFKVKEIVWAKVSSFPWWPARVVKLIPHDHHLLFKVHFFGDPSYSYVQQQDLLSFSPSQAELEQQFTQYFKFQKPLDLAKAALLKQQSEYASSMVSAMAPSIQSPTHVPCMEETKISSTHAIEHPDRTDFQNMSERYSEPSQYVGYSGFENSQISTENVIDILEGTALKELRASKGYHKKKQILQVNIKLKEMLLAKYNLNHKKKNNVGIRKIFKVKQGKKKQENNIKKKCIRTMYRALKKEGRAGDQDSRRIVINVLNQLDSLVNGDIEKYRKAYRKLLHQTISPHFSQHSSLSTTLY